MRFCWIVTVSYRPVIDIRILIFYFYLMLWIHICYCLFAGGVVIIMIVWNIMPYLLFMMAYMISVAFRLFVFGRFWGRIIMFWYSGRYTTLLWDKGLVKYILQWVIMYYENEIRSVWPADSEFAICLYIQNRGGWYRIPVTTTHDWRQNVSDKSS